jgi:hypothetical protein
MSSIKLGTLCRDVVSGYIGVVTQRIDYIGGMTQFALQPRGTDFKDGKYPDGYNIDEIQIVEIADPKKIPGYKDFQPIEAVPADDIGIQLGAEVEDVVSGFRGHVVSKTTFINGCVYFAVETKANKDKPQEAAQRFLPAKRLKVRGVGVAPKVSESKSGGPVSRAMSAR